MASLNKIIVIGNTGSDPEMRFTPDGKPVTNFSLATNRTYTGADGEKVEKTTWFKVTCWNKLAETVNQYLAKGRQVYVEGRVELQEWEGEDGTKRSSMGIIANSVVFLGKREETVDDGSDPGPVKELESELPF